MLDSKSDPQESSFDAKAFLKKLPSEPGVYRMLGEDRAVLYVGKAKALKSRVSSYFLKNGLSPKTQALVRRIADIEITITASETEALILEQNMIKDLLPPYNILLRDDKSYPYIFLADDKTYPSISLKRVRKKGKTGQYFGPFPSAGSVRESLGLLEKAFKVRQCEESFYKNRSRPCLQYQIKRCKAPCVGLVSQEEYANDVKHVVMFLQGKNPDVIRDLIAEMEKASDELNFERAAEIRDQVQHLRHVQELQVAESGDQNLDVIGYKQGPGVIAYSLIMVRNGRVLGHKNFLPKAPLDLDSESSLQEFVAQLYLSQAGAVDLPSEVVIPHSIESPQVLEGAIKSQRGKNIRINASVRHLRQKWLSLAATNAESALKLHLENKQNVFAKVDALRDLLGMDDIPKRMECFDISHSSGERTVGSCVVFNDQGPLKSDYRRFNVEGITGGDDYAAMKQVLMRRYRSLSENPDKTPDIIFVDGGKGQLSMAVDVLNELNLRHLNLIGIAKGVTRKPGMETLLVPEEEGYRTIECMGDHPGLHLIQQIRDEAHRFAITGHRQRRDKARTQSQLEGIPGVGAKRRKALIQYFGSAAGVKKAPVDEIAKVSGISASLAEEIYAFLHSTH